MGILRRGSAMTISAPGRATVEYFGSARVGRKRGYAQAYMLRELKAYVAGFFASKTIGRR